MTLGWGSSGFFPAQILNGECELLMGLGFNLFLTRFYRDNCMGKVVPVFAHFVVIQSFVQ